MSSARDLNLAEELGVDRLGRRAAAGTAAEEREERAAVEVGAAAVGRRGARLARRGEVGGVEQRGHHVHKGDERADARLLRQCVGPLHNERHRGAARVAVPLVGGGVIGSEDDQRRVGDALPLQRP